MLQRQKTCVVHTKATCSRDMKQGQNHNMCTHLKILRVHFSRICCSDMYPRVTWYFYNCATPIWGSPFVLSPWRVLWSSRISTSWDTSRVMSLQHIPETCTHNNFIRVQMLWFCPCYMYPLRDRNACRLSVYYTSFCHRNMSLQHDLSRACPSLWKSVSQ